MFRFQDIQVFVFPKNLRFKTITSQNTSTEAQIKIFFTS